MKQRVLLLLWVSAIHGLLLLNDGIYWDGWILTTMFRQGHWRALWQWFGGAGLPFYAAFHWGIGHLPNPVAVYRAAAFFAIVGSALAIYDIARESGFLARSESVLLAMLATAHPAFEAGVDLSIVPYLISGFLFLVGTLLAIRMEASEEKASRRACALAVFCVSFSLNSFLVFYFAFLALLFFRGRARVPSIGINTWVVRHLDLLLLPFAFWFCQRAFVHRDRFYESYNQFHLSLELVFYNAYRFLQNSVYGPFAYVLDVALSHSLIWLVVWAMAVLAYKKLRVATRPFFLAQVTGWGLCAFGALSLFCGTIAYIAVGKSPPAHGWDTRHSLLVGLPVAILAVGVLRVLHDPGDRRLSLVCFGFVTTFLLGFGWMTIASYLSWQARWVKDRSVMQQLAETPRARGVSIFWVDDEYSVGREPTYEFFEWTGLLASVWEGSARIGLDRKIYGTEFLNTGRRYFTEVYNLGTLDVAGCQAVLHVQRARPRRGDLGLSLRYFYYKWFARRGMRDFLATVAEVDVRPIPGGAGCHVPEARD